MASPGEKLDPPLLLPYYRIFEISTMDPIAETIRSRPNPGVEGGKADSAGKGNEKSAPRLLHKSAFC
jgi:hypothetical protein